MKRMIFLGMLFMFIASMAYAVVELDGDANGGQDIDKGGTNAVTASAARTNLGLAIGSDIQAYDATIVVDADIGVSVQAYSAATALNIASGTSVLATASIASETCAIAITTTATGTVTTDVINWGFNGDPTAVTGYVPVTEGMLTIIAYPTANNVNYKVCNLTAGAITPGAITLNWRVTR